MSSADETLVPDSNEPDYSSVEIPAKPPSEYSYTERRAELLEILQAAGHPRRINQTELAQRFDVSQQQVSQDIDRLATHVRERVGDRNHRALIVDGVVSRSIQGLLDEGEYRKAAKTALEWEEWATDFHDFEELHAHIERLEEQAEFGVDR